MSTKMVRVLRNPGEGSPEFDTVPFSEVPPGYINAILEGFGECFVDPTKLKSSNEPQHGEFPESVRVVLRRIAGALVGLQTQTLERWEHGFRCDRHAWREIAIYERVCDGLERFAGHLRGDDETSSQKRRDVFNLIMGFTNGGPIQKGVRVAAFGTLTANRVREIGEWMFSTATVATLTERARRHRDAIMPHALAGPERVSLDALFGDGVEMNTAATFNPRELLDSADVILGVDIDSGREFLAYGRERLKKTRHGASESARVLRVELDQSTDDLEKFIALVETVKGHHDYGPSA